MGSRAEVVRGLVATLCLMQVRDRDSGVLLTWWYSMVHIVLAGSGQLIFHLFDCVGECYLVYTVVHGCDVGGQWWEGGRSGNVCQMTGQPLY